VAIRLFDVVSVFRRCGVPRLPSGSACHRPANRRDEEANWWADHHGKPGSLRLVFSRRIGESTPTDRSAGTYPQTFASLEAASR
jgi:hypothetical protein